MANKIILGAIFIVLVIMMLSLTKSDEPVQNYTSVDTPTKIKVEKKDDIEVLYLDEKKSKDIKTKVATTITNNNEEEKEDKDKSNIENLQQEEIKEYIAEKGLNKITSTKSENIAERFSVYADISVEEAKANRDKTVPPPAPVIYTITLPSGQIATGVIDGDVHNQATTIIATENDSEGNPNEAGNIKNDDIPPSQSDSQTDVTDNSKKIMLTAPPQIGQ